MELYTQMPFFNTIVPSCLPLTGALVDGTSVTVTGQVLPNSDQFAVNLQYGSKIALHVNPRYTVGSERVVHNTFQNGRWGPEEIKHEAPFPRGQLFALQILVTLSSYKMSTNGKPFSEYNHRMPFSLVDSICVRGMVEVNSVAFQPHHSPLPGSFVVPHKSIIHGGVKHGRIIILQGFINPEGNRIELHLRHRTGIALHYSARLDENKVVCNSYEDGIWGEEEQSDRVPFKRGEVMQVTIICRHHHYEVFVNGEHAQTYTHRFTNLEEIDVLEVSGDVQLSFVQA